MEINYNQKHENLRMAGLFNSNHQKITEPLFSEHPEFFDPCDNLQVRYEILRSNMVEGDSVVDVCRRFGITRQSFYTLQEKLLRQGTAGLLPRKPGPRGPSKLTEELLAFINQQVQQDQNVSIMSIINDVQVNFGVSLHRRTIEKLVKNLRVKKNFTSHHRDEPCQ
jgi:transposase